MPKTTLAIPLAFSFIACGQDCLQTPCPLPIALAVVVTSGSSGGGVTGASVAERMEPFIKILREAHAKTPIILLENVPYPDGDFVAPRRQRYSDSNARLRDIYQRLTKAGDKNLLYVTAKGLIGTDGEATVDGTHPTDLGFMRMADAIEPALRRALKSRH